ncbi:MAG: S49 family peptidase [Pelagibacterales bacterium]|nr:S49 family peptidase [Pelagibacterales bacterium]
MKNHYSYKYHNNIEPTTANTSDIKNCRCLFLTSFCVFLGKIYKKIFGDKNTPKVVCLNLHGVIGKESKMSSAINIDNLSPLLKRAFETKNIKAVALNINSPGGSPVQSELIYNYVRELSDEKKIPVYTFAQDVAASGGYWLLLSGDEIYAHNSSIIGSIGVIFYGFGFVDLIKKIGIERRVYTEGKNKAVLDPFMPEENENIEILKDAQRDIFESFKELVKVRRQGKLRGDENKIFTGAFWSGKRALQLGLIDEVCDMRKKMKEKFGNNVEFIQINSKKGLLKSLFSEKTDLVENLLVKIEEKINFNKFGL